MRFKIEYSLLIILLLHISLVFFSMSQMVHGDEIAFPECAKGVIERGKPVFDVGILKPNLPCLQHPPTYVYLVALSIMIFGENVYSFRLVSAIFNLLTIILVYFTTKEIFTKNKNKEKIALIASFLYALNPLAIQSSIVIDIDGGLLNFLIIFLIYFFVKKRNSYWIILPLFLVFWSKETGSVLLFASFFIFYAVQKDWKNLFKIITIFFISGILFLVSFWIYTAYLNLDFTMPFKHNFNLKNTASRSLYLTFVRSAWAFKTFFYFTAPFFIMLFLITSTKFYYNIWKKRKIDNDEKNLLFLNIFSFVTIILFTYLGANGWGFPKYYIAALPAMSIFIAGFLLKGYDFKIKTEDLVRFVLLLITMIFYFVLFFGDPLIPEFDATAQNADFRIAAILILKSFILYVIIPFFIALFFSRKNAIISLIFLIIIFYSYINILHAGVNYSTYYNYGDNGLEKVIEFFKDNNIEPNQILSYPNLGYYIGMSDYNEIMFVYNNPDLFRENVIENNEIIYMVIYERDIGRIGMENMKYFKLERKFGTYYIFKKII